MRCTSTIDSVLLAYRTVPHESSDRSLCRCSPSVPSGERSICRLFLPYAENRVLDLPFLRPHQRAPWHSFCVQLAALALHRAGHDAVVADAETWRDLLRRLTADWTGDEPWRLVVEDVAKPAFMQPPVPAGSDDPHRTTVGTADDLDVLVTAKNHGVKQGICTDASPAAWVAALVLLQTTGGFLGAGNYGIARMNGGFATRPWSASCRRAVSARIGAGTSPCSFGAATGSSSGSRNSWRRMARRCSGACPGMASAASGSTSSTLGSSRSAGASGSIATTRERSRPKASARRQHVSPPRATRATSAIPGFRSISARSPQPTTPPQAMA